MVTQILTNEKAGYQWIDVSDPTEAELKEIAVQYSLHPTSVQDCLEPEHLPKFEKIDNIIFIIFRIYEEKSTWRDNTVRQLTRKIAIFSGENFIITVHRQDPTFLKPAIDKSEPRDGQPVTQTRLLLNLLNFCIRTYEKPFKEISEKLEEVENRLFEGKPRVALIQQLFLLKLKASVFSKMLEMMDLIIPELYSEAQKLKPLFQDTRELSKRYFFRASHMTDNINNTINLQLSLQSYKANDVMRVLTIFSVFFLPATFIVGIYGMNFEFMPEINKEWGYPAVMLFILLVSIVIFTWFKRKKWL
ncbi:MAG: CorA family divalent cation transporter [Bacteroidota bacterium]